MKNFVQKGNVVTVAAPSGGVVSGEMVLIGSLFGVAATTQAEGSPVELALTGVFDLPKVTGAISVGAPIYFDVSADKVDDTHDTGTNLRVGIAVEAALEAAATVRVRLDGAATTIVIDTDT
jgi:predicted RecA/RadA family phage recombinase